MSNELCDRCGKREKMWMDTQCIACWNQSTTEYWSKEISRMRWLNALVKARSLHPDFDSLPL